MPDQPSVPDPDLDGDLIRHVAASVGIQASEASRVIADVVSWYRVPIEGYVRHRHARLQARGVRNDEAYARIARELRVRPVAAPELSVRQVRRMIYG